MHNEGDNVVVVVPRGQHHSTTTLSPQTKDREIQVQK